MNGLNIMICAAIGLVLASAGITAAYGESVTGSASYRERQSLPHAVIFKAVLEDVSIADQPSIEIGRLVLDDSSGPAIPFEIPHDPSKINLRHPYGIRSTVRIDEGLILTTDSFYSVITGDALGSLDLLTVMVDTPKLLPVKSNGNGKFVPIDVQAAAQSDLAANEFGDDLAGTEDMPKSDDEPDPYIEETDPPMRGMVAYGADGPVFEECKTGVQFPVLPEGDSPALEHAYLAAGREPGLPIMASFDGDLVEGEDGSGTAVQVIRFIGIWPDEACEPSVAEVSLTNTYWSIIRLRDIELSKLDEQRDPHMILPSEEPRFTATVGCNQMMGGYELSGNRLTFGEVATTMMACPAPVMDWEQKLAAVLGETTAWQIDGETLELLDATGQTVATFQAVFLN